MEEFDWTTVMMVAVLAMMVLFMIRNSRKRKADLENLRTQIAPGAEVMTSGGLFGVIVSIDEENNQAVIESVPGTRFRVHTQAIGRVVEPVAAADATDAA
ncbi:preprotein translocase subunit YajC [Microbacteriaceae bacterium MWH-Ta3]|nr:preprotein translocase subunit YajC [Microbacteriaceae bacterium MWH-Ta3]